MLDSTGCGKTTVINLLMRFYDTDRETYVSDKDIKDKKRKPFVACMVWFFKTPGCLKEPLEKILPMAKRMLAKEVKAAAKAAHAHSFIKRLPNGYDTLISEDGSNISQGQKQLLSIARVMLTNRQC